MNKLVVNYKTFSPTTGMPNPSVPYEGINKKDEYYGLWIGETEREHRVRIIGYEHWPPTRKILDRIVYEYTIHFVVGGKGTYNGEPISVGDAFITIPEELHSIISDPDDPLVLSWLLISRWYSSEFWSFISHKFKSSLIYNMHPVVQEQIFSLLEQIFDENNFYDNLKITYLANFVISIFSVEPEKIVKEKPSLLPSDCNDKLFKEAIQYIDTNFCEPISTKYISQKIHVSQSYLFRLFKKNLGMSPQVYLLSKRMEEAKKYISANEKIKYKHIAANVGYKSYINFEKYFKLYFGMTPSELRELIVKDREENASEKK